MAGQSSTVARPSHSGHGPMNGPVERAENSGQALKQLGNFSKSYIPAVSIAFFFGAFGAACQIAGPEWLKKVTDAIAQGMPAIVQGKPVVGSIDLAYVERICFVLLGLYVGYAVLTYAQSWIMATMTQRTAASLRQAISQKINRLPLRYFDKVSYGDVLSRITNDVDAIGQTLGQSLGSLVISITTFVGSLIMMFLNDVTMSLVAVGSAVFGSMLMMVIMGFSQKYFVQQQEALGDVNGHVEEKYSGHIIVKAYSGEKDSIEEFERYNASLYDSGWKSQFFSSLMMPLMNFVGNFGYVAVCVVGASLALNGKITFGVIVAFMMYIRLFTQPLSQFAQAFQSLQRTAAASERVFTFLDEPEMSDESQEQALLGQSKEVEGHVIFRNVNFSYDGEHKVIHDFSAEALPGQKIALVGPTGAGKTTMVNLLMRFYELDSGDITIDGVSTKDVPRSNVHEQFAMVLQDTWIFRGTVKENIIYAKQGVSDEQVVAACKAVGLDRFIRTLPQGYDTMLTDETSLSQGQRQLMTIARAMIQNAPILILDEATSSVDTRTEEIIQQAMDSLSKGRTSFVIAHRLSTIRNADSILVMQHGRIVERGTHEELLQKGGYYAELYNSQFASSELLA